MAPPQLTYAHRLERGRSPSTLLLLHATGGDEHQLVDIGRQLAPSATLLSPRGTVLENGAALRFFARDASGIDMADFVDKIDGLAQFVREAITGYGLDPELVWALGYSNGANAALGLHLRHPSLLAGSVLLRPSVVYTPPDPPDLQSVEVLLEAGAADPYSPDNEHETIAAQLRDGGADVDLVTHRAGHGLVQEDFTRAGAWLGSRLR